MFKRHPFVSAITAAILVLLGVLPARAAIMAHLETPSSSEIASGIGSIQGWAFATAPGDAIDPLIDVYVDGAFEMQIPCCSDRGDVKQAHPSAPVLSGFAGALNYERLTPGAHTMEVRIYSKLGEQKSLTTSFTSDSLGSYAFNNLFDWDDAKADHCIATNVTVNGEEVGRISCTGVEFTNPQGFTEHCEGEIQLTWMPSSQGFRVTKGCSFINWEKPPLTFP